MGRQYSCQSTLEGWVASGGRNLCNIFRSAQCVSCSRGDPGCRGPIQLGKGQHRSFVNTPTARLKNFVASLDERCVRHDSDTSVADERKSGDEPSRKKSHPDNV